MWDYGFTMGVTVTEQLRTFGGRLEMLELHLERLNDGLGICGIESGYQPVNLQTLLPRSQN